MTARRPMGELLGELAQGFAGFGRGAGIQPRSLHLRLPIDLRLAAVEGGFEIIGDVPLFVTRTAFDPDPARIEIDWHLVPLEAVEAPR